MELWTTVNSTTQLLKRDQPKYILTLSDFYVESYALSPQKVIRSTVFKVRTVLSCLHIRVTSRQDLCDCNQRKSLEFFCIENSEKRVWGTSMPTEERQNLRGLTLMGENECKGALQAPEGVGRMAGRLGLSKTTQWSLASSISVKSSICITGGSQHTEVWGYSWAF